ncbi:peptidoglycan editing factor PgeF [Cyanobium sp. HWJ4-Hawea]|uniref:peptidoglycan editing factor PgeF n=1 Tax=Cyanobium sp. HWJ4-Hawea TaxID=2823713 RepID=UPI0020CFD8C7|nr:peptidoglycan editing factor PgeF [Cyanobium sp. HWJ4-Hawea]MCP9810246.1 peptidoglycan editing factor PgeF [Cyanobium sp. HWJ4-Hawea]
MAEAVDPPFDRPDLEFNQLEDWTWVGCYGGYYLQSDLLADFEHGFFTRQWQGRTPEVLAGYVSAGVSVHRPQQVHSALVIPASQASCAPWPEADGLVSDGGGQSLWVCGADCTPVLLADPATGHAAACHAGWRGVAGRILELAVGALVVSGSRSSDLLVALGPAIAAADYQVQRSVSEQVALALRPSEAEPIPLDQALADLAECGGLQADGLAGHDRLDIRSAARQQLIHLGVGSNQIAICPLSTATEPLLFHSWRRDQVKAVQWSGIVSQA